VAKDDKNQKKHCEDKQSSRLGRVDGAAVLVTISIVRLGQNRGFHAAIVALYPQ
jgi:hypothetical protein